MKKNKYSYETTISNSLDIYQAHNGKIYLKIGKSTTPLTYVQVQDLQIDLFSLKGFDCEAYINAYTTQPQIVKYA